MAANETFKLDQMKGWISGQNLEETFGENNDNDNDNNSTSGGLLPGDPPV
jgi:hypothetical protein